MEQPFAPRAAAPKGELRKSGDVTEVWAAKVDGAAVEKRLLTVSLMQLEWFSDAEKKQKAGSLKTDSFMSVVQKDLDLQVQTATKTHVFRFNSKEDTAKWKALLSKNV
jgi:hypothetical protein